MTSNQGLNITLFNHAISIQQRLRRMVLLQETEQLVKFNPAGDCHCKHTNGWEFMKTVVMALSGGMDSTCLLMHYLSREYRAIAFHITMDKNMQSNLNERPLQFSSVNRID